MADSPPYGDTGDGPALGSTTGAPRWVKVFGVIALVLVLLVVILLLVGGHGPGRHTASGEAGGQPPSSSVTGSGGLPPTGSHTP